MSHNGMASIKKTNVKFYETSTLKYLHIVLSIYFSVYNLTMATRGPKHVVVNSFPPTLFN